MDGQGALSCGPEWVGPRAASLRQCPWYLPFSRGCVYPADPGCEEPSHLCCFYLLGVRLESWQAVAGVGGYGLWKTPAWL